MIDLHGFTPALIFGTLMTIKMAFSALALGLLLGMAGALAKTSSSSFLRWLGNCYSSVVRGVPELLWVLLMYFGTVNAMRTLGAALGMPDLALSPFAAGTLALGMCFGAYATEVFRGALIAIPVGQGEAGRALGMGRVRVFFSILLPQMWRIALPALGNLFMILMKDTALVSVIGMGELMRTTQRAVTVTREPFTFYLTAALIYLMLTVISMIGLHWLERRASRGLARA